MKALREIRFYQKTTHLLIPRLTFCRLVKEIMQGFGGHDFRISAGALEALQTACESFVIRFLEECNLCAIHCKRVTLQKKDLQLMRVLKY